ncbi:o-succinylbenzoate synthase [Polystyrenella longa]|uniref:O-succinylbenzoate synthase n=1 Tax=Polystyrenella longa TaxID=2528007 RepID=A0A518CPB8_9PLAN|nr:mandelate racemase/muconate lactonizing enzyme family protein [Polystyrenella longa]QDU81062.1 o-succinylbenzoate synthase [Polystyrenella longa]
MQRARLWDIDQLSRREFLGSALMGLGALTVGRVFDAATYAAEFATQANGLEITDVKRVTVEIPFRAAPERAMRRELPHWKYTEIFEVTLSSGAKGVGETLLYYTWGVSSDEDVQSVMHKNALDVMWDDALGAGLQMAIFDAVARNAGVPVHRLLGKQVNDVTPLSWWNIDTSPEDMASECRLAYETGYMSYKTKGRPWWDLWRQLELSVKEVPSEFKIDMDFNDTLWNAELAIPIIKELEMYPQIDIYESPIPQRDIEGNQKICAATNVKIAHHYGSPEPVVSIRENVCDGYVVGGGATGVMKAGAVCEMADKPFWLQLVGTGLTAAFSLHFGAVNSHATWPAVNCHQLYAHDLLKSTIKVQNGVAEIPQTPGLGYKVDWDVVEKYKVEKPAERPNPPRMMVTIYPDGRKMYFSSAKEVNFHLAPSMREETPFFVKGVTAQFLPDDGTAEWREMYEKATEAPVLVEP